MAYELIKVSELPELTTPSDPNVLPIQDGDYLKRISFENLKEAVTGDVAGDLAAEVTARESAVSGEATARGNADTALQNAITAEATAREAADSDLRNALNEETARVANIENKIDVVPVVEFEQGTISSNGQLNNNTKRIRTIEYYAANFRLASVDSNHKLWVAQYDSNKQILSMDITNRQTVSPSDLVSGTTYIKFVIIVNGGNTDIVPTDITGFSIHYDIKEKIEDVNLRIDEQSVLNDKKYKNRHFSAFPRYAFLLDGATPNSDATIVGDKYVVFGSGSDNLTAAGTLNIYTYANGFDKARTNWKRLYHLFGHCNTVDYSAMNDALILGNGSGGYNLVGKIIIIPNFTNVLNDTTHTTEANAMTLSDVNAIVIDCASYNLGAKFNVIWGEYNGKRQDIAYLITAKFGSSISALDAGDNGTIRRLLLGTGTNQLDYGQYSVAEEGAFNGTFDILDTYTQSGTAYDQANQGSCYYNGEIYAAIGHEGLCLWKMRLDNTDHGIWYDEYKQIGYALDGSISQNNITSVCKTDDYIFVGQANIGVLAIPI